MGQPKPIKICLTNQGEDQETPWAHDLGAAPGGRKVRLINVPFMHAKPTWGDVIIVKPVEDGLPTWDRGGVPWSQLDTRILEDGGRWAMIVDYRPAKAADAAFKALAHACAELDIVCEGAWGPKGGDAGRAYLAVKHGTSDTAVMNHLRRAELPCKLDQIHPAPPKPKAKTRKPAKKPIKPKKKPAKK